MKIKGKVKSVIFRNGYINEITQMMDKYVKNPIEYFHTYLSPYTDDKEKKCIPIRYPGSTIGRIITDLNDIILKIEIYKHAEDIYNNDITEEIEKYIGLKLEILVGKKNNN